MTKHPAIEIMPFSIDHIDDTLTLLASVAEVHVSREDITQAIANGRVIFIARSGESIIGYFSAMLAPPDAEIHDIAVSSSERRSGVGAMLVERFIDEARAKGVTSIFLEVAETNSARAFYAHLGFSDVSTRKDYYGSGKHARVMKLRIAEG